MSIKVRKDNFVYQCDEHNIRHDLAYSGRGMFGKNCVAIYGSTRDLMEFAVSAIPWLERVYLDIADEVPVTIREEWLDVSMDSMGHETVFYWRRVQIHE